uniref:Uncharacterized protein n=1 Tax=Brassica oleracea var. oleracea TaxID=109376 RepID=A0A0D3E2F8_BRAOL
MGRYSYSQPSSSEEYDIDLTSLLQAEADLYADEAESSHNIVEPVQYPPQPESDDGIPKTYYYGGEIVVATAYTSKEPGRRYFTCENADDGDCHVWKWWDVAVMEELRDYQKQLRELKDQANESDEKLVKVEKTVGELAKKKSGIANGYPLVVCHFFSSSFSSFFVEVSRTPPSRVLLLTPSRTCLDAAASLPPLWASNDSVLHLLLYEGLCIFSFDSLYYATPYLFSFSICRRQWWLSLLDLLCSEQARKSSVILRLLTSINSKIVGGHLFLNATSGTHITFDKEINLISVC